MRPADWAIVLSFVATAFGCSLAYDLAPRSIAVGILPFFAVALIFGPSLLYPLLRQRGVSAAAAIGAALLLPALWLARECYRTAQVFSVGEGLYYAFNPLMHGFATVLAVQLALWETAIRWRRRERPVLRGWPVATLAVIAIFWSAIGLANYGRDATAIHYAYIEGYRRLFGP